MDIKTVEDAKALVGKTFGSGKNARTVDRIEGLTVARYGNRVDGNVYWGRPGSKVRTQSQWLSYFLDWMRKAERDEKRAPIVNVGEFKNAVDELRTHLLLFPDERLVEGYIERDGNKVTIVYEVVE
jgi:hypothetical protein